MLAPLKSKESKLAAIRKTYYLNSDSIQRWGRIMKAYREIIEAKWYCQNCVGDRNTDEYSDSIGLGSASIHIRCYECKESIFLHLQGEPPTWKGLEDRVERLEHRLADISDAAPFSFVEEKVGKVSQKCLAWNRTIWNRTANRRFAKQDTGLRTIPILERLTIIAETRHGLETND